MSPVESVRRSRAEPRPHVRCRSTSEPGHTEGLPVARGDWARLRLAVVHDFAPRLKRVVDGEAHCDDGLVTLLGLIMQSVRAPSPLVQAVLLVAQKDARKLSNGCFEHDGFLGRGPVEVGVRGRE
jgi:hypothetical protein